MNIAGYHRQIDKLLRDIGATPSAVFEADIPPTPPWNVIENITLVEEPETPAGFALFLAQTYQRGQFMRVDQLRQGDIIVERGIRGKKSFYPVADVPVRSGRYGQGHIIVVVSHGNGRLTWRYEPEHIVEIDV